LADNEIDREEENCRKKCQNKDHSRGQKHFAAGWPDNLCDFGAGLLQEL
jgi:hypothetical protein